MSKQFPLVQLGKVLNLHLDEVPVDPAKEYRIAGIYSFGKGMLVRGPLSGSSTTYKVFNRLHENDFVISQPKAWEGAVARVSKEFDGWFISPVFPTFRVDSEKLLHKYLEWFCKQKIVWDELRFKSRGIGARRETVYPEQFLSLNIALPPLEEQQRIVVCIESLAAKIEEARKLRKKALEEAKAMIPSLLCTFRGRYSNRKKISECANMSTGTTPPSYREDYYGGNMQWYTPGDLGYQKKLKRSARTISSIAVAENKARLFEPGTILLVAIGGSLGKVGLTEEICSSNQQITGIKFSSEINPEYGWWWMRGLSKELMAAAPQATLPIINQAKIGCFEIAVPPLDEQQQIVRYFDGLQSQIESLKHLQEETSKELEAMLPSVLDKAFKGEL